MTSVRRSDFDVTNSVQVSSPRAVLRAVEMLYRPTWPGLSMEPLARAFEHFERLFAGHVPGYHGVDTVYHDRQHTLDITLALARPVLGFGSSAPVATEIIHFTGYEQPFARIEERVSDPRDITVGHMLGTADMIAQMADRCYLEKCRDRLYAEFVVGGVALPFSNGNRRVKYASGLDLLRQTPDFVAEVRTKRLDGDFRGAYRYLELLFDG